MKEELVTIKTFVYDTETLLYEPKLKNAGIFYLLKDQKTVSADPIVSNAIGGIKLQVRRQDIDAAQALIQEIDNNRELSDFGKEKIINGRTFIGTLKRCPNCGSENSYEEQFSFWKSFFSKKNYYCKDCKQEWH